MNSKELDERMIDRLRAPRPILFAMTRSMSQVSPKDARDEQTAPDESQWHGFFNPLQDEASPRERTIGYAQPEDELARQVMSLVEYVKKIDAEIKDVKKDIRWVRKYVDTMKETAHTSELTPDNFDMTSDQIRDLILKENNVGEPFYPSDIASKYGLDYDAVLEAVDKLRHEGRIKDRG